MTVAVHTGVWIGALDLPWHGRMMRHTVLDDAQRYDYPPEVGGQWAYAACGDPVYFYEDGTAAVKSLPPCWRCQPPDQGQVTDISPSPTSRSDQPAEGSSP